MSYCDDNVIMVNKNNFIEKVGEGATAEVYKCKDESLGVIAQKRFYPQYVAKEGSRARVKSEFQCLKKLNHKNIVQVFDLEISPSNMFLKMEYVEGENLTQYLKHYQFLTEEPLIWLLICICKGLGAAHEQGILHRDLKSDNILIGYNGDVKISDFGLSKVADGTLLTKTGMLLGSLGYMAPEVIGGESYSIQSDIFSFGVIAYEVLSGKSLFLAENPQAIIKKICLDEEVSFSAEVDYIPTEIKKIILSCLSKNKKDRPSGIWEVEAVLLSYLYEKGYLISVKDSLRVDIRNQRVKKILEKKYEHYEKLSKRSDLTAEEILYLAKSCSHFFPNSSLVDVFSAMLGKESKKTSGFYVKQGASVFLLLFVFLGLGGVYFLTYENDLKTKILESPKKTVFTKTPEIKQVNFNKSLKKEISKNETLKPDIKKKIRKAPKKRTKPLNKIVKKGFLNIKVDQDVRVQLDGRDLAQNSLGRVEVEVGLHKLTLIKPGYDPIEANIYVSEGKESLINARRKL